ncbi:MAG: Xaa-Pro peptidase family protein [Planctomycetota bacterium]
MHVPPFAEFPTEEYEKRIAAVRALMRERGIEALLLFSDVNLRYLAGVVNAYWIATMADDVQCLLLPADEEDGCVLMLPDHLCHGAARSSWIADKRAWSQFGAGKLPGPIATILEAIREKWLDESRIAMEVGANARLLISPHYFQEIKKALPDCEIVDAEELLARARVRKSDLEIACLRRAAEITCEGMRAGLDAVRENASELDIAQRIVRRWSEVADDFSSHRPFFLFVYSSPLRSQWFDCGPSTYRLRKGDYCVIDIGFCYKGYWADFFRTACIGDPSAALRRFHDANMAANVAGIQTIRPGATGTDVTRAVHESWKRSGLEDELREQLVQHDYDFVGHGIGLTLHDIPLINSRAEVPLEPGMVVAIEGMLVDHMPFRDTTVAVGTEDNVLVTHAGCEVLTPVERDLLVR